MDERERIAAKVRRDFPNATPEERAWHETWEWDHRGTATVEEMQAWVDWMQRQATAAG